MELLRSKKAIIHDEPYKVFLSRMANKVPQPIKI